MTKAELPNSDQERVMQVPNVAPVPELRQVVEDLRVVLRRAAGYVHGRAH